MKVLDRAELGRLKLSELDEIIAEIHASLADAQAQLALARRMRAAKLAAVASVQARQDRVRNEEALIRARWEEIGVGGPRNYIPVLMEEFGLSERTIHRRLGDKFDRNERLRGRG